MKFAFAVVSSFLVAGCATIDRIDGDRCAPVGSDATPVEAVQVMNTNWLLLSFLPIASGDPEDPNRVTCRWFRNTATLQNQMNMLEAEARRVGADKALDVTTAYSDEDVFLLLFRREKILTSAILVKDSGQDRKHEEVKP